jgi:hypothetical protein
MWRFIEHPVMRPALWTWELVDGRGKVVKKSAGTFSSYRKALHDAARHGFDAAKDEHQKIP